MFFMRGFAAVYKYVVAQVASLTTYINGQDDAQATYTDEAIATLTTYIDNAIAGIASGHSFVDRGDPSPSDFNKGAFTLDGTWRELDLSSIIPTEARLVMLRLNVNPPSDNPVCQFRKKGNSNSFNVDGYKVCTQNVSNYKTFFVPCGADGIVEYLCQAVTYGVFDITVGGWWE